MFKTIVEVNIGCDDLINELESLGSLEQLWVLKALYNTISEHELVKCFDFVGRAESEVLIGQAKNFVKLAKKAIKE